MVSDGELQHKMHYILSLPWLLSPKLQSRNQQNLHTNFSGEISLGIGCPVKNLLVPTPTAAKIERIAVN
jgi:hypothetical protein